MIVDGTGICSMRRTSEVSIEPPFMVDAGGPYVLCAEAPEPRCIDVLGHTDLTGEQTLGLSWITPWGETEARNAKAEADMRQETSGCSDN